MGTILSLGVIITTKFCNAGRGVFGRKILKLILGRLHEKHEGKRGFETKISIRSMTEENHTET